jgi:hypothetical protein
MQVALQYFLLAAIASVCLIGIWYSKRLNTPFLLINIQCFVALVVEITAKFLIKENTSLYNIYIVLEVIIVLLAGRLFSENGRVQRIATVGLIICVLIWVVEYAVLANRIVFLNTAFLINCVMISALYMVVMIQSAASASDIFRTGTFWLCLAHILYFGSVIPFFAMYDYFTQENFRLGYQLYLINSVIAIVRYVLIAASFWLFTRRVRNAVHHFPKSVLDAG